MIPGNRAVESVVASDWHLESSQKLYSSTGAMFAFIWFLKIKSLQQFGVKTCITSSGYQGAAAQYAAILAPPSLFLLIKALVSFKCVT